MKRALLVLFGLISLNLMGQTGSVLSQQKIADTTQNFSGYLTVNGNFGSSVVAIGDLDGDGVVDLVAGEPAPATFGDVGAVYTLFMNRDGSVKSAVRISQNMGGFTDHLHSSGFFGSAVAFLGDLDLDGYPDIAVSARMDTLHNARGAVWIIFLKPDGTAKSHFKISATSQNGLLGNLPYGIDNGDNFGWALAGLGDLDLDGIPDLAVATPFDDDGGSNHGAIWMLFLNRDGSVKNFQKISSLHGNFTATLDDFGAWARSLATLGDLDGDGIQDLMVGYPSREATNGNEGSVMVLFLNRNGTVKSHRELSSTIPGSGLPVMPWQALFGNSCAPLGDIDADGIPDVAVGSRGDNDQRGELWILLLNTDGTVKGYHTINSNTPALSGLLEDDDLFGLAVTSLGDLNGDGKLDLAVGAWGDDDGGHNKGAIYILNLESSPIVTCPWVHPVRNVQICQGDSFYVGNVFRTTTGTYYDTLPSNNGCDSLLITHLSVTGPVWGFEHPSICEGDNWNGHTQSGTYVDTLMAASGCDSIHTLFLTVLPTYHTSYTTSVCSGSVEGYTATGVYTDTFTAANGCDSVRVLDLTVGYLRTWQTTNVCYGMVYNGHTTSGLYIDTMPTAAGCDEIYTLDLTVLPENATTQTVSICQGERYAGYGTSGTYIDTLRASNGCDSIRIIDLTVSSTIVTSQSVSICQGESYQGRTATGLYRDTFTVAGGCDSIHTLSLRVANYPEASITTSGNMLITPTVADTYQWYLNGVLLAGANSYMLQATANGDYTVVMTNAPGCADTSAPFTVTGVGIGETVADWNVKLYPNPTDGKVHLAWDGPTEIHWAVYNGLGQQVRYGVSSTSTEIDLSNQAEGAYYVRLTTANGVLTKKLVLTR